MAFDLIYFILEKSENICFVSTKQNCDHCYYSVFFIFSLLRLLWIEVSQMLVELSSTKMLNIFYCQNERMRDSC